MTINITWIISQHPGSTSQHIWHSTRDDKIKDERKKTVVAQPQKFVLLYFLYFIWEIVDFISVKMKIY